MVRERLHRIIMVIVFLAFVSGISILMLVRPAYIGYIVGIGGNVTRLDLSAGATEAQWFGLYGDLSETGLSSISLGTGSADITRMNILNPMCFESEVYATTLDTIDWNNVEPATPADVDAYLGVSAFNMFSGTRVFTATTMFVVNNQIMQLPSTRTYSVQGSYDLGVLKSGSTPIFVTQPTATGRAFDGTSVHYQLMLPVQSGAIARYYFFWDPSDPCNRPPVLSSIGELEGYIGKNLYQTFYATDPDDDRLTMSIQPDYGFLNLRFVQEVGRYLGSINFTPRGSDLGTWPVTFTVSDGFNQDKEQVFFNIGFCGDIDSGGDTKCQSRFEDCETCSEDCGSCSDNRDSMYILSLSDECFMRNMTIAAYERHIDTACKNPSFVTGLPVCNPIAGVPIDVYFLVKDKWKSRTTITTKSNGRVNFVPEEVGEYKLKGEKNGFHTSFLYFNVKECPEEEPSVSIPVTGLVTENITKIPQREEPKETPEHRWIPSPVMIVFYNVVLGLGTILLIRFIRIKHK